MSRRRSALGSEGEALACRHLAKLGYRILARNYRGRCGEIDIVAEEGGSLIFVEVKTRSGPAFGHPLEAVTPRKQRQLGRVASEYLAHHGGHDRPVRFDVLGIALNESAPAAITLVRDAFVLGGD